MLAKAQRCRIDRATTNLYQRRPPSSTRSTLAVTGAGRAESIMFIPQLGQQSTSVERMNACQCQVTSTAMGSVRGTGVCKRCNGSGESTGKLVKLPGHSTYSVMGKGEGLQAVEFPNWPSLSTRMTGTPTTTLFRFRPGRRIRVQRESFVSNLVGLGVVIYRLNHDTMIPDEL